MVARAGHCDWGCMKLKSLKGLELDRGERVWGETELRQAINGFDDDAVSTREVTSPLPP